MPPVTNDVQPETLPKELNAKERAKVAKLLNEPDVVGACNSPMLGIENSKLTSNDRLQNLFREQKLSPITELVLLCRIERAKVYSWELAVAEGKSTEMLPEPDYKRYIGLLRDLAQYEVPLLKSVDVTGKVDIGMQVHVMQFQKEQKVIEIDSGAPEKLRQQAAKDGVAVLPGGTLGLVDKEMAKIINAAVGEEF